jgi:hypothetical protein
VVGTQEVYPANKIDGLVVDSRLLGLCATLSASWRFLNYQGIFESVVLAGIHASTFLTVGITTRPVQPWYCSSLTIVPEIVPAGGWGLLLQGA